MYAIEKRTSGQFLGIYNGMTEIEAYHEMLDDADESKPFPSVIPEDINVVEVIEKKIGEVYPAHVMVYDEDIDIGAYWADEQSWDDDEKEKYCYLPVKDYLEYNWLP